ncbi:LptF/LptG family permease [Dinghuibacter silviterrae]|uniref:LptF/LptG family permease n=1 Tax=Dinghuibacter silviterrae TaxID=1539049 RepID=UPI001FEC4B72|nr:LptF/LptG family permease [Dinghuibacter silviterrae]
MIKKLDRLIIKAFIGPFLITFLIALFILVMQFFWKYIDDLVGKGLDSFTLLELTGLVTTTWVPIALPLSILLSSIMTFGNLGESFELVAIKSAGIPLLRFMRPLIWITAVLCVAAFLFANYVIPVANLKFETLLQDIQLKKPAFDIKEGVFYNKMPGYTIKISKKDKTGSLIDKIVIFEQNNVLQDNLITADRGVMSLSSDKQTLNFKLVKGIYYQEKGPRYTTGTDFIRLGFQDYTKHFDLSSFAINRSTDSLYKDNAQMLSVRQLSIALDSLHHTSQAFIRNNNLGIRSYLHYNRITHDTTWTQVEARNSRPVSMHTLIPDSLRWSIDERARSSLSGLRSQVDIQQLEYSGMEANIRVHLVEWHRKFSLSVACMVLFLIGAPLGSIIRKGGLGLPLVFAVIFFVIFHLLNTFGEKFARGAQLTPFLGMWLSVFVMLPIGFFLTYKAMQDSQLFNKEFYFRTFKWAQATIARFRRAPDPALEAIAAEKEA